MQTAHTTAYSIDYSYKIKEKAERRRLFTALEKLTLDLKDHTKSPLDIIASANSSISAFSQSQKSKRIKLSEYAKEAFSADLDKENIYSDRKTGFDNLDALQNFLPGVYVIGAQPALGKTTFAWQLAENLATHGDYCIFCSYEMSRLEMFCKSLARRAFYYDNHSTLSATDIRRKAYSENVHFARADIADSDMNLDIMEMQNETVDELLALIRPLCQNGDKAPVVFIDYLQIIPCSNKKYTKEELKISIDDTLRKLKVFQRDTGTTFFVISSFNRSNYNQSAAFEAFKESGGIEYSSDVIWALQLYVTTNFKGGKTEESKRKEIEKAKNQQPRQMVLQCLKNRFGGNYNCYFNYYSRFDYFEPCEESDFVVLNAPTEPPTISDEAGES
jgi:replicative DNA helicase